MAEKNLTQVIRESLEGTGSQSEASSLKEAASWLLVVIGAVAAAFLLNRFIIVNAQVVSGSMENTVMTGDRVIGLRVNYWFTGPKRGDIIFFLNPDNEAEIYVKRVIGEPGDVVEIRSGNVYINGVLLRESYLKEAPLDADYGPYEVPEDSYFMLGDNRNRSKDSRMWNNTYVHRSKVLGKAYFIYYPRVESVGHAN